ncbi:hypothetical protein DWV00_29000 [Trinickia dinghuensis]|uniref:Uncharacterized protein n=1 Tax=Trinickia dinghuensis TaxID=2291023 RepID=A0A3D8JSA6_9BURK|nr:hypothetical protein DWV00_29000 [Trinickia dinghuensis]
MTPLTPAIHSTTSETFRCPKQHTTNRYGSNGTSRATVIPFAIALTLQTSFAIGEITQRQGISAMSQQ